jgi:eukaryotic-like serine/threonine-protein kinase
MSDVFLALMSGAAGFSKLVVVKRLEPLLAKDAEFLSMFLDEARLAARLNHPNVVQTLEVGFAHERYFLAMEYLDGQPLNRILRKVFQNVDLDLPSQLRILSDTLCGLHYAHELRDFDGTPLEVVHRDVSPQNVFVTYEGQVKVVDFGVAKAAVRTSDSRSGMIKGKIAYMAPEQALGQACDRRADIFSLGIMLWEIAARRRMWKGKSVPQILRELVAGELPQLGSVAPETHPALLAICARATAHDPDDRFASAAEFRAELDLLIEQLEPKSGRDLGSQLRRLFAEERARVQDLIEHQLGHLRLGSDTTPTGIYEQLPRLDESEPPLSGPPTLRPAALALGHGFYHHGSDASAYSMQLSSIRPEHLGVSSPGRKRAIALSVGLGLVALLGAFALVSALPEKATTAEALPATRAPAAQGGVDLAPAPALTAALVPQGSRAPAAELALQPSPEAARQIRPAAGREQAPARESALPRVRHFRDADEGPLQRSPGRRRAPRHLDKEDPWSE